MSLVSSKHQDETMSLCDDSFFLKQVASHVRKKVLNKLDVICGNSLYCDVMDLEAICGDILKDQHEITNEVLRRKRETRDSLETFVTKSISMLNSINANNRQLIDIVFKLVGSTRNAVSGESEQNKFVADVVTVQRLIVDSSSSGELGERAKHF